MTVFLPDTFLALTAASDQDFAPVVKLVETVTGSTTEVKVSQLKGGITNQLLLVEQDGLKLLVRAFGKGTNTFIDREREFAVHQRLQTLGLAPTLYCQFGNGLIYGFIPGRPAEAAELGDEYIMKQVANRLAQWHALLTPKDVVLTLGQKPLGNFWDVLEHWVDICPDGVLPLTRAQLETEFQWLKVNIAQLGGPEVMGHCDLLSANILVRKSSQDEVPLPVVPHGVEAPADIVGSEAAFIDYEYSIPCPRAFDISNHFQEWQGYECNKSRVPEPSTTSPKLKFWCDHYLHAFTTLTNNTPQNLSELITELQAWWGMPGFYWGVWSAIQSKSSDIDFGYHDYASNRFQEYLDWKSSWRRP